MRVGHTENFKQALNTTILAPAPMQRVEDGIGLHLQNPVGEIAARIDFRYAVAAALQCVRAALARNKTDIALRAPSALQHRDMLCVVHVRPPSLRMPMRRISHSSVTPLVSITRARTSSPRSSRSLALALPVLMRKLQ